MFPRIDNPRENNLGDKLINIQYEYLTTKSKKSWNELWLNAMELAGRCLTLYCRQKKWGMPEERFREVQLEAVTRLLARYKNENWYVKESFYSELRMAIVQIIHHQTKAQRCMKLATTVFSEYPIEIALQLAKQEMEKSDRRRKENKNKGVQEKV